MGVESSIALRNYADEPGDWSWLFDSVAAAEASGFDRVVISEHIAMGDNWTPAWVDLDGEAQVSKHNVRREREERPPRVSVVAEHAHAARWDWIPRFGEEGSHLGFDLESARLRVGTTSPKVRPVPGSTGRSEVRSITVVSAMGHSSSADEPRAARSRQWARGSPPACGRP